MQQREGQYVGPQGYKPRGVKCVEIVSRTGAKEEQRAVPNETATNVNTKKRGVIWLKAESSSDLKKSGSITTTSIGGKVLQTRGQHQERKA